MTVAAIILTVWLVGSIAVVAMCRAAARGDRALERHAREKRLGRFSHEHPLAA